MTTAGRQFVQDRLRDVGGRLWGARRPRSRNGERNGVGNRYGVQESGKGLQVR
jgi:hypothetical protein